MRSHHRKVKETLDARSEYTSDDTEGTKLMINQCIIKKEIGQGSYAQSNIVNRPGGLRPGYGIQAPWSTHRRDMNSHDVAEEKDSLFLIREEIAIMKKLNHPSLVSLIEVLDDAKEDSLWIVLKICKKGVIIKVGLDKDSHPYSVEQYFRVSEMFEKSDDVRTAKSAGSPAFLPLELCMAKHDMSLYCLRYGRLLFHRPNNVLEIYKFIRTKEFPISSDEDPVLADCINMRDFREGGDPLLSEEENATELIEPPNELEVNHASTTEMSHMLTVIGIEKSRVGRPDLKSPQTLKTLEIPDYKPQAGDRPRRKSINDKTTELLEAANVYRDLSDHLARRFLASEKGHAQHSTEANVQFLVIGLGDHDEFEASETPADLVSDSPNAIDFNIYERALEAKIERIRSNKPCPRRKMSLTRFVKEKEVW
ncbi:hypothetical protein BKA67DRAFT_591277 [Truncatella angustata]|uniref:Protein kinase domain-containing protein n=1 Tax=Truncatella angustata TaxID=152316 RepID=A0A9P9A1B5_9PEZI|nr:uncharacterized protein BKA67DRAFT_591277 [Truncatella angustata]KAH6658158.1 hypothetical protein BKA67DRAFT_591277 [Truncatella angustata]